MVLAAGVLAKTKVLMLLERALLLHLLATWC
jgi:hypothetical protein